MPQYVVKRNKKDTHVVFGKAARSVPPEAIGSIQARMSSSGHASKIDIVQTDRTEEEGSEYLVLYNIPYGDFRTRTWNEARTTLGGKVSYGSTTATINALNTVIELQASDLDTGSGGIGTQGSINTSGIITASSANFTGNVTIGGTLTYEDVKNVDSLGIITARSGIQGIGIQSGGTNIAVGVLTALNFIGAGNTFKVDGTTVDISISGGGGGNPVTSGIITGAGSTTLRLTLQDATNVDVDVTSMRSTTSIGTSTAYFFLNNGAQLSNNQHDKAGGVVFYGTPLTRGEELVFTTAATDVHVGVWNGGNGITGITNVNNKSNWSTKWYFDTSAEQWDVANGTYKKTGVDQNTDLYGEDGTYAIRYDYDSEKLQLWEIDGSHDWLLSTANAGVGTTSQYIYFSSETDTQASPTPGSLPVVSSVRPSNFHKISSLNTPQGPTIHHGVSNNDVWKSHRSLKPGEKIKFTVPTAAANQYWAVGYEGSSSQSNAYAKGTGTWRLSNTERIVAFDQCGMNTSYTAHDVSLSGDSYIVPGKKCSWRYNTDNSWDIYDEDLDEVILTGDNPLDGNAIYPHLMAVTNGDTTNHVFQSFQWEWNSPVWYSEYRDYTSGASGTKFISRIRQVKPLKKGVDSIPTSSGGYDYLGNANYRVTWGEKMRPGQEFSWTQLADNSNGATKHNMTIGVLNSNSNAFDHGMKFYQGGYAKLQEAQDSGFTVSAGGTTHATAGTSMRLKYESGTNKLVCDKVDAGVRTKIAESTSALDGEPIFITLGGESTRLPVTQGVSVYGWECVHEPPNYYNPWKNWRIGGFPENQVGITTGDHAGEGTVLGYKVDQVWRHKDGLPQGYQMTWTTAASITGNQTIGQWKTSNASSGITGVEADANWDWAFQTGGDEDIDGPDMVAMTINTSNSNYVGGGDLEWQDPNPGSTVIGLRYHSNNTIDLYDFSGDEIIGTVNATQDGNPVYISVAFDNPVTTTAQMNDDFFGGGDVGIALTTN